MILMYVWKPKEVGAVYSTLLKTQNFNPFFMIVVLWIFENSTAYSKHTIYTLKNIYYNHTITFNLPQKKTERKSYRHTIIVDIFLQNVDILHINIRIKSL